MSDTPRTDALMEALCITTKPDECTCPQCRLTLHARELERELEGARSGTYPCCGEYATCKRACTPRGEWLARNRPDDARVERCPADALRRYGHHDAICDANIPEPGMHCTCGFEAALEARPETDEERNQRMQREYQQTGMMRSADVYAVLGDPSVGVGSDTVLNVSRPDAIERLVKIAATALGKWSENVKFPVPGGSPYYVRQYEAERAEIDAYCKEVEALSSASNVLQQPNDRS